MTKTEQFFYEHAGYSVAQGETEAQGRERGARALAEAEAYAQEHDWQYAWEHDIDGCIGCECDSPECACSTGTPHETLVCILRDADGKMLESLGSICDPSREYGRVVEAELALEAMAAIVA
jgi:hypothetical protein